MFFFKIEKEKGVPLLNNKEGCRSYWEGELFWKLRHGSSVMTAGNKVNQGLELTANIGQDLLVAGERVIWLILGVEVFLLPHCSAGDWRQNV